jgi:hypothetical protein
MNIIFFQISVIIDLILLGVGVYMGGWLSKASDILDKIHAALLIIYSSAFVSFLMFQLNPLFIIGSIFDWFIFYMSGYLIGWGIKRIITPE